MQTASVAAVIDTATDQPVGQSWLSLIDFLNYYLALKSKPIPKHQAEVQV